MQLGISDKYLYLHIYIHITYENCIKILTERETFDGNGEVDEEPDGGAEHGRTRDRAQQDRDQVLLHKLEKSGRGI